MPKIKRKPRCPACGKPNLFGLENIVCDKCEAAHSKGLTELEKRQRNRMEMKQFYEGTRK